MPPQPVEDIGFPALGDDLIQLLLALLTLIGDLCNAIWSLVSGVVQGLWTCVEVLLTLIRDACVFLWNAVSQAVSAVWTYFLKTFWNEFVGAITGLASFAAAHTATAIVMFVIAFVFIPRALNALGTFLLGGLDDERSGALRDSYAANYQSTNYRETMPNVSTQRGHKR